MIEEGTKRLKRTEGTWVFADVGSPLLSIVGLTESFLSKRWQVARRTVVENVDISDSGREAEMRRRIGHAWRMGGDTG